MNNKKKPRPLKLHPIEARILRGKWASQGLNAKIHALTGDDAESILSKSGSMFWVVLWAAKEQRIDSGMAEIQMIRAALKTLGDITEGHPITEHQRGAVSAGLYAVDRLSEALPAESLFAGGLVLKQLYTMRAITLADFEI